MRQKLPECKLVIAGRTNEMDPAYEQELHNLVNRLKLNENVQFIKDEDTEEKVELLASSRFLSFPQL